MHILMYIYTTPGPGVRKKVSAQKDINKKGNPSDTS
jgi:hypothetical protein